MESAFSIVEGVWKNFQIKKITAKDYPAVYQHIKRYFIQEEPLCKLLGVGANENFGKELCALVEVMLKDNLSFVAFDVETNEIAGLRITFSSSTLKQIDEIPLQEMGTRVFWNGIDITDEQRESIYKRFKTDSYAELFIASTAPHYQKQGLATELYRRSLSFLKARGFLVVKCIFTGPVSRNIAVGLGFEEIGRIYYKDLIVDKNYVFSKSKLDSCEHYAAAMVKPLE